MNRDYFTSPHQSRHDSRVFGKTGPVLPMEKPGFWKRLFGKAARKQSVETVL